MNTSGRGVRQKKRIIEESYDLSIFRLRRENLLVGSAYWRHSQSIAHIRLETQVEVLGKGSDLTAVSLTCTLTDTQGRQYSPVHQTIQLTSTSCQFGSRRWWFVCPRPDCQRTVAILYTPLGQIEYACRVCHALTYQGRQQHRNGSYESFGRFRAYRRRLEAARSARQKLTWLARLMKANERIEAYRKAYDQRFWKRLERLKRMDGPKVTS